MHLRVLIKHHAFGCLALTASCPTPASPTASEEGAGPRNVPSEVAVTGMTYGHGQWRGAVRSQGPTPTSASIVQVIEANLIRLFMQL